MHTNESKVLIIAVFLITIGIQSNFGSLIDRTIGINFSNLSKDLSNPMRYKLDGCIPIAPESNSSYIRGIQTNGNCINIYSQENCVGQLIRVQAGTSYTLMLPHRWGGNIKMPNEDITFGSIGPCLDICDLKNWVGMRRDISAQVTLYNKSLYAGGNYTYSLSGMQCITIPSLKWMSIKISGTSTTTCVELHDDATCEGNSVQLRPGYPHLHDILWWGFDRQSPAMHARSVSLCGYGCLSDKDNLSTSNKVTTNTPTTTITMPTMIMSTTTTTMTTKVTTFEEPGRNQSNLHVHKDVSNSQGEQPSDLPVWAILLIMLAILLVLGLAGFGVVHFFRRYRNVHFSVLPSTSCTNHNPKTLNTHF